MPSLTPRHTRYLIIGPLLALSAASSYAGLPDTELAAMRQLVLGPKHNEVKSCLDASFGLLEGLIAAGRAPDEKVAELLTKGEMSANQRQMREQQVTLWKEHHAPAKLANFQYHWCLKDKGMPVVDLGALGEQCFNVAMVPAYASLLKTGMKASQEEATAKVVGTWQQQVSAAWLTQVVGEIYAAETVERTFVVSRRVFMGCIASDKRP